MLRTRRTLPSAVTYVGAKEGGESLDPELLLCCIRFACGRSPDHSPVGSFGVEVLQGTKVAEEVAAVRVRSSVLDCSHLSSALYLASCDALEQHLLRDGCIGCRVQSPYQNPRRPCSSHDLEGMGRGWRTRSRFGCSPAADPTAHKLLRQPVKHESRGSQSRQSRRVGGADVLPNGASGASRRAGRTLPCRATGANCRQQSFMSCRWKKVTLKDKG